MEKILKLIKSPISEDIEIGVRLLLSLPPQNIVEFFEKYGESKMPSEFLDIKHSHNLLRSSVYFYVDRNRKIINTHKGIRLRYISSKGYAKEFKTITIKEYLDGEYI